jgi:hypothetical protein
MRRSRTRWLVWAGLLVMAAWVVGVARSPRRRLPLRGHDGSRVFHDPSCRFYDSAGVTVEFASRAQAIAAGWKPCKLCRP